MKPSRRAVLTTLAAAPMYMPSSAAGANDRPNYAVIGTGGRGRFLNRVFQEQGAQCVALADVYSDHLEQAVADSPEGVKTFVDYNEVLALDEVDAVVLAGPDHHHCPMVLASLKANKDIYTEKPLSWSLAQSQIMIDAVRETDRIVQVGMQRRSYPPIISCKNKLDEGAIGEITMITAEWNWKTSRPLNNSPLPGKLDWERFLGDAPQRPLEPMRFRSWRNFIDYAGGHMTDQGTHLMDVVQWFANLGAPVSAVAQGYLAQMEGAEHPDIFSAIFQYSNDVIATWTLNYTNAYDDWWTLKFRGTEGTLVFKARGYEIYTEPWAPGQRPILSEWTNSPSVPVEPHIANFLECVGTRQQPTCPVDTAAESVSGLHLANLAMYNDTKMTMEQALRSA